MDRKGVKWAIVENSKNTERGQEASFLTSVSYFKIFHSHSRPVAPKLGRVVNYFDVPFLAIGFNRLTRVLYRLRLAAIFIYKWGGLQMSRVLFPRHLWVLKPHTCEASANARKRNFFLFIAFAFAPVYVLLHELFSVNILAFALASQVWTRPLADTVILSGPRWLSPNVTRKHHILVPRAFSLPRPPSGEKALGTRMETPLP